MKANFDFAGFYEALCATIRARNVTMAQVGHQTGVSASTLSRMAKGQHPDAASLAALSAWAGINPAEYCPKVPQPITCPHCHGTGRVMPEPWHYTPPQDKQMDALVRAATSGVQEDGK